MTTVAHPVASGPGWRVHDVVCSAGPHDRPFEERHETLCVAIVSEGTFQYRCSLGAAVLAPGALLLGNAGACFECGHEHAVGDRCLSFHLAPELAEEIAAAVPGVRRTAFAVPHLPPQPLTMAIIAAAEAARADGDRGAFEELALRLPGLVFSVLSADGRCLRAPSARDARRVTAALRRIEAQAQEPLSLATLAREAAMSPYHFLRTFRAVVGMTPHQYLLHTRLQRAAVALRRTHADVAAIACGAGFGDLSTFNRRFRRVLGMTPSAYRMIPKSGYRFRTRSF